MLKQGFDLLATDVSMAAISFCRMKTPDFAAHFQVLDSVSEKLDGTFDFIYSVGVVHMLVPDTDRNAFYQFIRSHLKPDGSALICTIGDGSIERQTDISTAFDIQDRVHEQTGKVVQVAGTSCRMVNFPTFNKELEQNGFIVVKRGITAIEPDFPQMMYAIVKTD